MREQIQARLEELKKELDTGQAELQKPSFKKQRCSVRTCTRRCCESVGLYKC
jgi:hypothetical protein